MVGCAVVLQAFVIRLVLQAGAEIICLLKESNSSRFSGKMVQVSVRHNYRCSLCNGKAELGQAHCSRCGAEFKPKESTPLTARAASIRCFARAA